MPQITYVPTTMCQGKKSHSLQQARPGHISSLSFPACTKKNAKIKAFIGDKFNTDLAGDLGLKGVLDIRIFFKIDQTSRVVGIRAKAAHSDLAKEAKRVTGLLPKMKPGKQQGKPVTVPYSLPIKFKAPE